MDPINILIVGSGGREHALAWKCAQSLRVQQLFVAPGNAGTATVAKNVPIAADDINALLNFALDEQIGLTVVGPEQPLADGLVDRFQREGLVVFGPVEAAARLEASKAFAKRFMREHGIPTGDYAEFRSFETAEAYVDALDEGGLVVKASGLAAGKGVFVCDSKAEALYALRQLLVDGRLGDAGEHVVVEERLYGDEVSLLAFCDGENVVPMLPVRDHKRVFDDDEGPNTGGMGVFSPVAGVDAELIEEILATILKPAVTGMRQAGTPYVGVLFAGLMLTKRGVRVLEFNCRFGDPETQVLMPLLESDLVAIMLACTAGELSADMVRFRRDACAAVVMASGGYPGSYERDLPIVGVDEAEAMRHTVVFHAGTAYKNDHLVTAGGRVLAVAARGADLEAARERAYAGVAAIRFSGAHYRRDIGRVAD